MPRRNTGRGRPEGTQPKEWPDSEWASRAACASLPKEMFYPTEAKGPTVEAPKEVCRSCPVRRQCLEHALRVREPFGIWGGLDERERRTLKRSLQPSATPGTPGQRAAAERRLQEGTR
jgi:WhiB family redox-sensing transcriptional regulator